VLVLVLMDLLVLVLMDLLVLGPVVLGPVVLVSLLVPVGRLVGLVLLAGLSELGGLVGPPVRKSSCRSSRQS
jgi:hypothetical protein